MIDPNTGERQRAPWYLAGWCETRTATQRGNETHIHWSGASWAGTPEKEGWRSSTRWQVAVDQALWESAKCILAGRHTVRATGREASPPMAFVSITFSGTRHSPPVFRRIGAMMRHNVLNWSDHSAVVLEVDYGDSAFKRWAWLAGSLVTRCES